MDTCLLLKSGFSPYCLAKDNKKKNTLDRHRRKFFLVLTLRYH